MKPKPQKENMKKRRRITKQDLKTFTSILHTWNEKDNGKLTWPSFINAISKEVKYVYNRSGLYKTHGGALLFAFNQIKTKLDECTSVSGPGVNMSRKELLAAYQRHILEIGEIEAKHKRLLAEFFELYDYLGENGIFPPTSFNKTHSAKMSAKLSS